MIYHVWPYDLPRLTLWSTFIKNPYFYDVLKKQGLNQWSTFKKHGLTLWSTLSKKKKKLFL